MALTRTLALLAALVALAVAASSAQAARFVHFKSPSGNIDCTVGAGGGGPDGASCMVRTASWPRVPAKPRSCMLDWAPTEIDLSGTRTYLGSCRGDIGPLCIGAIRCSTLALRPHADGRPASAASRPSRVSPAGEPTAAGSASGSPARGTGSTAERRRARPAPLRGPAPAA